MGQPLAVVNDTSSSMKGGSEVRYDVDVPDAILDPQQLGQLAGYPLWQAAPATK
jgi:hypothetical protein